jgi:hypothetical protein
VQAQFCRLCLVKMFYRKKSQGGITQASTIQIYDLLSIRIATD